MKKMIRAASGAARYDKSHRVSYKGIRYSIKYTGGEEFGDSDAMFRSFAACVQRIAPYDLAEYAWARIAGGKIDIIHNGRVQKTGYYFSPEASGYEDDEWADEVIYTACDMLDRVNKDIPSEIDRT